MNVQLNAKGNRVWFDKGIIPGTDLRRFECNRIQLACLGQSTGVIWRF
jgi:hypothetical protein